MNYKVYCIYDSKVEAYLSPLFFKSKGEFLRSFIEAVNDPKSNLCRYPADFTAFELGTFDDSNATFVLHKTPISLGLALEFKSRFEPVDQIAVNSEAKDVSKA